MKLRRGTSQIHQIAAMDGHGTDAVLIAQAPQGITVLLCQQIRLPLPGTGRKYLKSIGSQPVSTLDCQFNAARSRGMYSNAPGTGPGWFTFCPKQHIFHAEPFALWIAKQFPLRNGMVLT